MKSVNDARQLFDTVLQLDVGQTSGWKDISVPFNARYVAVLNAGTDATVSVAVGRNATQPPDAIPFGPGVNLSVPVKESMQYRVYWSSSSAVTADKATVTILFSNITIPIQGGAMASGGVASAVTVQNTVNTNATIQGTPNVAVTSTPAMTGSDYGAPAANHTIKVDANGTQYVAFTGTNHVTVDNTTLANAGIIGNVQTVVGTAAVELTVPTGARSFSVKNMDANNILYLGSASTVTSASGFPLDPKQTFAFDCDPTVAPGTIVVWAIASAAGTNVATIGVK